MPFFSSSQSSEDSLPLSSITLSPSLSGSSIIFSQQSLESNITKDLFRELNDVIECQYRDPTTKFSKQDSGYDTTPIKEISQRETEALKEFIPYEDKNVFDVKSYEESLSKCDFKTEAEKFIDNPDSSELFHPNYEYYEAKLKRAKAIPDLKSFIRRNIEKELNKVKQSEEVCLSTQGNSPPIAVQDQNETSQRSASPDMFENVLDDLDANTIDLVCCKSSALSTKELNEPSEKVPSHTESIETQKPASPNIFENELNDADTNRINLTYPKPAALSQNVVKEPNEELFLLSQCIASQIPLDKNEATQRPRAGRTAKLLEDIQKIMENVIEKTVSNEQIELEIRNSNISSNCFLDSDNVLTLRPSSECKVKKVSKKNEKSRFRFEIIMFLLSEIHHFLMTGISCTARELYYKDPEFVKDPVNIHLAMKDVCNLLNAAPWELGVFSSSKGLIAGSLVMILANGEEVNCALHSGGILLPHDTTGIKSLHSTAKYALVVEKDTVYEKLLQQNILEVLGPDIILITGKGFPDINTRVIVKKISEELKIPIFGLFDADPFGIEIFFVYRHGSRAMSFNADKLACPQVQWIGVHPSEIDLLGIPSMALSTVDKKKLKHLLERPYISSVVKNELEVMHRSNRKAEIEGISSFSENYLLAEYLPNKIKWNFAL